MTPTRWQQVKDVVGDALERADATERASFLARACADDTALFREVESLLNRSSENLDACAEEMRVTANDSSDAAVGQRIGAYEIVRELGRGGMGAVFLAARADQEFTKLVAIKILKRGTDTDEVLRRFRSEREILARLEHPNIARLIDAGTTDDGLPYFVMEYVVGVRVTDYCFAQNLSIAGRLALFLKICSAVQFAHQNLVVHRDLKPPNILITAEGEPKLLDFGIAKLLAVDERADQQTIQDQQRLTPAYASPEQVCGAVITTVSDVYTLGVLLYEMLTRRSPHRFAEAHPSPPELWRVVGEETPLRPSLAAQDKNIARRLRGDLDNILLMALRKEAARRYTDVGAFAEDIRRYLEKKPVRARPATVGYRARKFFSRNRAGAILGALALTALLAGTAITVWNAHRAQSEARRAEHYFQEVRGLANSFLFEFHDAIATLPGATAARQLVVGRALEYLDRLARDSKMDRRLQLELAQAYLRIGDVQGKPYTPNLGDTNGAIRSYTIAAEIAAPFSIAEAHTAQSEARRVAGAAYQGLATVEARTNHIVEATADNSRALKIGEQLLVDDPKNADDWLQLLVACHIGLGDAVQAGNHRQADAESHRTSLGHYRRALPLAERLAARPTASEADYIRLAKSSSRAAGSLAELAAHDHNDQSYAESIQLHGHAVELYEKLVREHPQNAQDRRNLADDLIMTANARALSRKDLEIAMQECTRALQIQEALAAADSSNAEAQQDLSFGHAVAGRVGQALGDFSNAANHYRRTIEILGPLVRRQPDNVETRYDLERARRGLEETEEAERQTASP